MKHRLVPTALAALLLLAGSANAMATGDSILWDSSRVDLVFPFEVGQEYEFLSSHVFTLPDGDTLAAGTVATVTIRDTVINDVTWLLIPHWSPFGSGIYRLDDSLRIWQMDADHGESMFMDPLRIGSYPVFTKPARDAKSAHTKLGTLENWAYETDFPKTPTFLCWNFPYACPEVFGGWAPTDAWSWAAADTALIFAIDGGVEGKYVVFSAFHGAGNPGACHHYVSSECSRRWSVFRPASSEPWPELHDPVSVREQASAELDVSVYPNPANSTVSVSYVVPQAGEVRVDVFSIAGQRVARLANGPHAAGAHSIVWNGRDDVGQHVGGGAYVIRLATDERIVTARVVLVR